MAEVLTTLIALPIAYFVVFLVFTFFKTISKSLDQLIFCSVCFAWASVLLVLLFIDVHIAIKSFALGLSITGIAYKLAYKSHEQRYINFFVSMLLFTIIGEVILYNFII